MQKVDTDQFSVRQFENVSPYVRHVAEDRAKVHVHADVILVFQFAAPRPLYLLQRWQFWWEVCWKRVRILVLLHDSRDHLNRFLMAIVSVAVLPLNHSRCELILTQRSSPSVIQVIEGLNRSRTVERDLSAEGFLSRQFVFVLFLFPMMIDLRVIAGSRVSAT